MFGFPKNGGKEKLKLEIEILMYWFLGSIIMGFVQFLFFFTFRVSLNLYLLAKKMEERKIYSAFVLSIVLFAFIIVLWLPRWCCDLWWWWLWWVVVATMVVMASGAVVGVVWGRGLAGCYRFWCSCFIFILMSSLYYLNEMVKNIEVLMFDES